MGALDGFGLIAAIAVASAGGAAANADRPIMLVTEPAENAVRLLVIGDAAVETRARYTLEVTSTPGAGGNRSRQSGAATLKPGEKAKLLDLMLGGVAKGGWTATLTVDPEIGESYEISRSSG